MVGKTPAGSDRAGENYVRLTEYLSRPFIIKEATMILSFDNWFLFPISILVATTAMSTGIGGAGGEFLKKKSYCGQTTSHNSWYGKADVRSR